jgi:LuxR family transcriptional regulator, maltose regulon positive regulatory protein
MSDALLLTKLYVPPPRSNLVFRPRLVEQLNKGLSSGRKLTLISAPAGFGKTTLVSEWVAGPRDCPPKLVCGNSVAWLSLDEADNDPARFISYLVAALQTILPGIGESLLPALQSPQPLHIETLLTALLNEVSKIPEHFVLILEDYHSIDSRPVDRTLDFLVEHQPPQMHLVITTREDPQLPLARYRARGQLTELRAADLRFTPGEAAELLNQVTGLGLSGENIAALETRTEGWIAGLQLAAISMQGHKDAAGFIQSFTGSHRFVMDYLIEEVLQQQSESIQTFLLHTSMLDRMCGPLCDAVLLDPSVPGQATLEYLEHANLFTIPLDNERGWYRYHHLFGDLLHKRLGQKLSADGIARLHIHASEWYENHDLMLDAFRHAALANDLERAIRLMESRKMPLHRRGTATTILDWLETLPETVCNARPVLWWKQASLMLEIGQTIGVEEKLLAAEACNGTSRDLTGKIALARAILACNQFETETILLQARRALEYLDPVSLSYRSMANLMLGYAYFLHSDLTEAGQAYTEALTLAQAGADIPNTTLAKYRLGQLQAESNQIHQAAETFQQILELISEYSPSNAAIAYMSLADINYEWNNLDVAEKYLEQSSQLAQQYAHVVDRMILNILYLARLKLAQGDVSAAESLTSQAEQTAQQKNIRIRLPDLAYCRAEILLRQGRFAEVTQLAQQNDLPLMHARALIALGEPTAALEVIEPLRQKAEAKLLVQRRLEVMTVQSVALFVQGEKEQAIHLLGEVLALAEPGGFVRLFLNEGTLMAELLSATAAQGIRPDYVKKLLATFAAETKGRQPVTSITGSASLVEPLSPRELEVLGLIAQGLSNQEICERLFLALDTVKGHNRRIFEKLQVQRRTEAIARARELNLF